MIRLFGLTLLAAVTGGTAWGQTTGTPRTQAFLLQNEFQGGQPAGSITSADMRDFITSTEVTQPVGVTATGTTQGTATVLVPGQLSIITACGASAGVLVSSPFAEIWNTTTNACLIYPISGASINGAATNAAAYVPAGGATRCAYPNSTQVFCR